MMKKILLFALLGLFAVSCNNDDPTVLEEEMVGTWEAQVIPNFTYPADMYKYIRFDGTNYYSSNTETTPSSNAKSYTITYNYELKKYVLVISGDSREYQITLVNNDLDLSYVVTPADPENNVAEVKQSLPYKRSQTAQTNTP